MIKLDREIWIKIHPDVKGFFVDLSRLIVESSLLISRIISIWLVNEIIIALFSSHTPFVVHYLIYISDSALLISFAKKSIKDLLRE
jgi:hypothetical protein